MIGWYLLTGYAVVWFVCMSIFPRRCYNSAEYNKTDKAMEAAMVCTIWPVFALILVPMLLVLVGVWLFVPEFRKNNTRFWKGGSDA